MALTDIVNEKMQGKGIFFKSVHMDPLKGKRAHVLITATVLWRGTSTLMDVQKQLYFVIKHLSTEFDHVIKSTVREPVRLCDIPENINEDRRKRMENRRVRFLEHPAPKPIKFSANFVWNVQDVS